eukprot:1890364-Rhodomonas_salina.2
MFEEPEVQVVGAGITAAARGTVTELSDPNLPLTLYTGCMAILNAIARWQLGDFQPRIEDEKHKDVLLDLLKAIRQRAAPTHIIWVAAHWHVGDLRGNELADVKANLGTAAEERLWDLDTPPIALYSTATLCLPLLHTAAWTLPVDKHARCFVGHLQAEWL